MKQPKYIFSSEDTYLIYKFESAGPRGSVTKIVEYTKVEEPNVYNLGFGDYDERTDSFDDFAVTDNLDTRKVLATVASTIFTFSAKYPNAVIIATGSTPPRTRLYQILIALNLSEIQRHFSIFGYTDNREWQKFRKGVNYKSFLLSRKENNIQL
jgi:hypothetical protein